MTKDEALKLALEALEIANSCVDGYYIPKGKTHLPEVEQAITAIKEALMSQSDGAQPSDSVEQEPVALQMDVIVVNLVREGINKHRARELAEHFIKNTTPPYVPTERQRKPLTDKPAVWSLNVDELAIYRDGKRFVELDWEGNNDSWREALRAGSEIVQLLNAASQPSKPLTDEQCKTLWAFEWKGERVQFIRAIEAAHGITDEEQPWLR